MDRRAANPSPVAPALPKARHGGQGPGPGGHNRLNTREERHRFPRARGLRAGFYLAWMIGLSGCQRAPSFSLFGSFFPVWLFCSIAGILLAFLVHLLLLRLRWDDQLAPSLLVWPAMATFFSLGLWLVLFG